MVGIALCHTIPRDNTIRVSIFLLLVSFVLTAIAIGQRKTSDSAVTLQGTIGGTHRTFLVSADIFLVDRDTGVARCTNAEGSGVNGCDFWVESMRAVTSSILIGFALTPLSVLAISFVTQVVGTTTNIILASAVCTVLPALTTLFGVAFFFTTTVPRAAFASGFARNDYSMERGASINLVIAACAIHCAMLVFIALRIVVALFFLPHWKSNSVAARNIDGVMTSHMANDDWERQQKVWQSHKVHVCASPMHASLRDEADGSSEGAVDSTTANGGGNRLEGRRRSAADTESREPIAESE